MRSLSRGLIMRCLSVTALAAVMITLAMSAIPVGSASAAVCRRVAAGEPSTFSRRTNGTCEGAVAMNGFVLVTEEPPMPIAGQPNLLCYRVEPLEPSNWEFENCTGKKLGKGEYIRIREVGGPFVGVGGKRLEGGERREILATAKSAFVLKNATAQVKVECKALKLKSDALLNGSSGENASTSKEIIEYSQCKGGAKEEKLTECEPESGKITTNTLVSTLGFANGLRTGPVLVIRKAEVGSTFASIKFTGALCFTATTVVTGSVIGGAYAGGVAVEEGKNETEKTGGEIRFVTPQKTIWTESSGKLTTIKGGLTSFGTASSLEGEEEITLASKAAWGVFT